MDLLGREFGKLKVFSKASFSPKFWACRCFCERTIEVSWHRLLVGKLESCGCTLLNSIRPSKRKTGYERNCQNPLYVTWTNMHLRVNSNDLEVSAYYKNKGIKVCAEWCGKSGFITFCDYMGPKPDKKYTLDRIDNTKGYEPGNVRWASRTIQTLNRQINKTQHVVIARDLKGRFFK